MLFFARKRRKLAAGRVRMGQVLDIGGHPLYLPLSPWKSNQELYEWATIAGKLLTTGDPRYKIAGMLMEFQNVADPEDEVTPPEIDRAAGKAYYNSLSGSPDIDYLRVPLTAAVMDSTNPTLYPYGNRQRYFAITTGTEGVHGRPFSALNNSKVFGGGLYAELDSDDPTQDLLLCRFYYAANKQRLKPDNGQLTMEWHFTLE